MKKIRLWNYIMLIVQYPVKIFYTYPTRVQDIINPWNITYYVLVSIAIVKKEQRLPRATTHRHASADANNYTKVDNGRLIEPLVLSNYCGWMWPVTAHLHDYLVCSSLLSMTLLWVIFVMCRYTITHTQIDIIFYGFGW